MSKQLITCGHGKGPERLEELMNDPRFPDFSMFDSATKYLKEFQRCKSLGLKTSDKELDEIYSMFLDTFRTKTTSTEEARLYKEALDRSWPMMRKVIGENGARGLYYREQVVHSLSFYDALRRICDPKVPNATVLEAAYGVTYDIAGKYGELELDDPSLVWDLREPIMVEARWRGDKVVEQLMKTFLPKETGKHVMSLGCGLFPELRHYGFDLAWLAGNELVGVDLEFHQRELDEVFQYAHGKNFDEIGVTFIQDSIHNMRLSGNYDGWSEYSYLMGVASYTKDDDRACELLDDALAMTKPGYPVHFDVQIVDDSLRAKAILFGWCEKNPLKPEASVEAALERWSRICPKVGAKIVKCEVDPRNDQPVGVFYSIVRP